MKPFLSESNTIIQIHLCAFMKDTGVKSFSLLGNNFLQEDNKIRSKPKVFSAFLGNDKERETVGFLADTV